MGPSSCFFPSPPCLIAPTWPGAAESNKSWGSGWRALCWAMCSVTPPLLGLRVSAPERRFFWGSAVRNGSSCAQGPVPARKPESPGGEGAPQFLPHKSGSFGAASEGVGADRDPQKSSPSWGCSPPPLNFRGKRAARGSLPDLRVLPGSPAASFAFQSRRELRSAGETGACPRRPRGAGLSEGAGWGPGRLEGSGRRADPAALVPPEPGPLGLRTIPRLSSGPLRSL